LSKGKPSFPFLSTTKAGSAGLSNRAR
jgi:hypothetical protein